MRQILFRGKSWGGLHGWLPLAQTSFWGLGSSILGLGSWAQFLPGSFVGSFVSARGAREAGKDAWSNLTFHWHRPGCEILGWAPGWLPVAQTSFWGLGSRFLGLGSSFLGLGSSFQDAWSSLTFHWSTVGPGCLPGCPTNPFLRGASLVPCRLGLSFPASLVHPWCFAGCPISQA